MWTDTFLDAGNMSCTNTFKRNTFLLVMPGDVQLVVVVADEAVEPDSLLCALDLQRSGRVRWTKQKHLSCIATTTSLNAKMYCKDLKYILNCV